MVVVGFFFVGCPLAAAALLSCSVSVGRWLQPHFAVSATFDGDRWSCRVTQPVRCTPLWPASWLRALDKSRVRSLLRSREFGRFMMIGCVLCLGLLMIGLPGRYWMVMFLLPGPFGRLLLSLLCPWSRHCSSSCCSPWWSEGS